MYINLTRGQDALLIDMAEVETQGEFVRIDLCSLELPLITATEAELAAHAEAAAGALAGGDTATLAGLAAPGPGLGLEVIEGEGRHRGPQE